ncbi:MAG: hypothetical protein Q7R52_03685 [archaeon]|nr:hypothetical protein [archaeon]
MKKGIKILLIILGIIILIPIIVVVLTVTFHLCPPTKGPWPTPPWCVEQGNDVIKSSQEKLNLSNAVVVPTDLTKIDYPKFYESYISENTIITNPYCTIESETIAYPISYLGNLPFPKINGAPLSSDIDRAVGIKDFWVLDDPNINSCPDKKKMFEAYEKTLKRVKAINAQQIHITNYISFLDFKNATLDYNSIAISDAELRNIIETAKKENLEVILYLNVAPGNQKVSDIPDSVWLSKFIDNYEPFLLNQAKIAQETGIKGIMMNHLDYQPSIKGYEEVYQKKMLTLLEKVRKVYSGKIILLIEPLSGANLNELDTFLSKVDAYIFTPQTNILKYSSDKSVTLENLKNLYSKELKEKGQLFSKYNKPFYLRILIQSEKNFLIDGWNEDAFCIKKGENSCYQKELNPDFSMQAIAYEALLESIKEVHNKDIKIEAVDTYGYWFTDVMLPKNSQPQIAQSIRNKPAESIVKEWYKR